VLLLLKNETVSDFDPRSHHMEAAHAGQFGSVRAISLHQFIAAAATATATAAATDRRVHHAIHPITHAS
jgi:hypothetical protein